MSEMAKKARADSKAKALRMINESTGKVDASDFTPAEPLNADKKTGMRPVSRRAYREGGSVCSGENPKQNAGRKPRASGGNVKSYATEDAKKANADKFGQPHVGGFALGGPVEVPTKRMTFGQNSPTPGQKNGGKVKKADGGPVDTVGAAKLAKTPKDKYNLVNAPVPSSRPGYDEGAVNNAIASSNRSGRKIGGKEAKLIHSLLKGRKAGGSVTDGTLEGTRPTGGRKARATGGKVKKGTNINIIINSGPKPQDPAAMPPKPPMPPPPPPPPMPPMGGPPPGAPPGMPPGAGGAPPMPMMRKAGGRTNYMSKEAGSGSGLSRLQREK